MTKYIECEAAIAIIEEKQKELCPIGMYSRNAVYGSDREKFDELQEIIDAIESITAADVVPVVRCSECKFWNRERISVEGFARCNTGETGVRYRTKNDFCSHGMRMYGDDE